MCLSARRTTAGTTQVRQMGLIATMLAFSLSGTFCLGHVIFPVGFRHFMEFMQIPRRRVYSGSFSTRFAGSDEVNISPLRLHMSSIATYLQDHLAGSVVALGLLEHLEKVTRTPKLRGSFPISEKTSRRPRRSCANDWPQPILGGDRIVCMDG